jgi:hypothetical protein
MVYCSSCGAELRGALKFCNRCGYRLSQDELDQLEAQTSSSGSKSSSSDSFEEVDSVDYEDDDVSEVRSAEVVAKPYYIDSHRPPGTVVKERIPKSKTCNICGTNTDEICFFCDWGICKTHSIKMQIKTDTGRFGNTIESCPDCADRKEGKQPSQEEAAEVGFFFKIKPYHEWKICR